MLKSHKAIQKLISHIERKKGKIKIADCVSQLPVLFIPAVYSAEDN